MIKKKLAEIHNILNGLNDSHKFGLTEITGVSIDSRKIGKGNLFVPFKGEHVDGHQFVEKAIQDGAAAALWQKNVPNPPQNLPIIVVEDTLTAIQELARSYRNELQVKVVGVTGSNGKTTTKDMVASLLSTTYKVHKTTGNFNNHLGLPLTILSMPQDTEALVLEMGMSGRGEIEFLSKLACPDLAIITNIGESHLLDLGSREGIAEAKLEILCGLKQNGTVIFHGDEPLLTSRLSGKELEYNLQSFGRLDNNYIYPINIETSQNKTSFETNLYKGTVFTIPVLGNHNVQNALAAILAAVELKVPVSAIQEGFQDLKLTNMRMEMLKGTNGETIINDAYNASPTSMKAAIELLSGISGFSHKYLVLGDMLELGPTEEEFHYKIGELIDPESIDKVFTFGKLGRIIAEGAKQSLDPNNIYSFEDKQELINELKKHLSFDDLVLVKASRGMKLEEVVNALLEK